MHDMVETRGKMGAMVRGSPGTLSYDGEDTLRPNLA